MLGHLADPFLGPDFDPKNGTAKCRKKEPAFRCSSAECGAKSCGLCPNKPHGDFGTLPFDKIWPLSFYELLLQGLHVPIRVCASEKASCRRFLRSFILKYKVSCSARVRTSDSASG